VHSHHSVFVCWGVGSRMAHCGGVGVNGFRNHIQISALCAFSLIPKGNTNVHTYTRTKMM